VGESWRVIEVVPMISTAIPFAPRIYTPDFGVNFSPCLLAHSAVTRVTAAPESTIMNPPLYADGPVFPSPQALGMRPFMGPAVIWTCGCCRGLGGVVMKRAAMILSLAIRTYLIVNAPGTGSAAP
jgi:hypothetical protein